MANKIVNDSVHGSIELHPLCVKIIDTPQFQRLRFIKQLGFGYFVYPGASHNRFEHSIGTCHLAKLMIENIHQHQPELGITPEDILCVQIAGLCHDLGHGPFSHTYEHFIKRASPDSPDSKWKHEKASLKMFDSLYDYLLEKNKNQHLLNEQDRKFIDEFEKWELYEKDRNFIKKLINPSSELTDTGRGEDKGFLYQIISNEQNGIDVDKWDYFARDCHHLGIRNNFDHLRLMKFARVIEHDKRKIIAYRDKVVEDIYNMFHLRRSLHKKAYQHRVVKCIEDMFVDALLAAKDHITRFVEPKNDMKAYLQLTDNIFEEILYPTSAELKDSKTELKDSKQAELKDSKQAELKDSKQAELKDSKQAELKDSKTLLERIISRDLYIFIGEVRCKNTPTSKDIAGLNVDLNNQLVICEIVLNYGRGSENPVDNVRFYRKESPDTVTEIQPNEVSHMLPKNFSEKFVQVFVKDKMYKEKAEDAFREWRRTNAI